MRIDHFLIGVILFSIFILGGVTIINDLNTVYDDVNMDSDDFGGVYDQIDQTYEVSSKVKNQTMDSDISDTDSWESMTKGSYSGVRSTAKDSFKLVGNITNAVAQEVGIPPTFIRLFMIILGIALAFAIIYMIFRFIPK